MGSHPVFSPDECTRRMARARDALAAAGVAVGLTFHPGADRRLEAGMVFHVYVSAAGPSFSETVLVGAGGAERLTRTPGRLLIGQNA